VSTTRICVERHVRADPTGTALLLSGPAALELWPGVRRVGELGGRVLVEADVAGPTELTPEATSALTAPPAVTAASVLARPPRRTATAFVSSFGWTGPDLPGTEGRLTLSYAPGDGVPSTRAELVLEAEGLEASRLDADVLTAMAVGFLANLAGAAESRRAA